MMSTRISKVETLMKHRRKFFQEDRLNTSKINKDSNFKDYKI